MKRTTKKQLRWYLSGEAAKCKQRVKNAENQLYKAIEDEYRRQIRD